MENGNSPIPSTPRKRAHYDDKADRDRRETATGGHPAGTSMLAFRGKSKQAQLQFPVLVWY